jgi:hypothetical protein
VIHVPLLGYVHSNPGSWLDGAWQISAVLVGLVTTLIIFLLQAATGQSMRSAASFRAILRQTYVLWPILFAIVFVAVVAIVQRFAPATGHDAAGWIESYALAVFVLQVLLFGVCIERAIRVVSPQGVSRVVAAHFRDGVSVSVEAELINKLSSNNAYEACKEHGVSFGAFLATGWPVNARNSGWIRDIDRDLPRRLKFFGASTSATVTAEPGEPCGPGRPIAVSTVAVGAWLQREIRSGVRTSTRRPPLAPLDVFNDAVDLARRSLLEEGRMSHDIATDLLADCFTAVHDAYAAYGARS